MWLFGGCGVGDSGVPFPRTFVAEVKQVFRRMFRVYAHIYHSHFQVVVDLGMEAHLNTSFRRMCDCITNQQDQPTTRPTNVADD
jgi:hypothetical protein